MSNQQNKLPNMYPMFTNVPSFWIFLLPSITHRPAGNCCTRPPSAPVRNSFLRYGWMIGQKTSYEIDSVGHPIFFKIYPFQPEVLSPTFIHWVFVFGICAIEMIYPLCKYVLRVFPFSLFLYRNSFVHKCFRKQQDGSEGSEMISTYIDFLTKSFQHDFIAYSHVFQVIMKLKWIYMKN